MKEIEIYDLKYVLSDYIYPRLKAFKEKVDRNQILSVPNFNDKDLFTVENMDFNEKSKVWSKILEEMLFPFEYYTYPENFSNVKNDDINKKIIHGLEVFAKYFNDLWI